MLKHVLILTYEISQLQETDHSCDFSVCCRIETQVFNILWEQSFFYAVSSSQNVFQNILSTNQ